MANTSNSNTRSHTRSISLPYSSHPSFVRIEEELDSLKRSLTLPKPTAETICRGLSGLEKVYKCMDEVLELPLTRKSISSNQNDKWINEALDISIQLLDVCNFMRDFVSQIKESIKDLQSSLRRRKGDSSSVERSIATYSSLRRTIKKNAKKLISELDHQVPILEPDHQISLVIRVIREVGIVSISFYKSLLVFMSAPNPTRWSIVPKLLQQKRVACEGQSKRFDEFKQVDDALSTLRRCNFCDSDNIQMAQKSLKNLEDIIESVDDVSENLFRGLIKARSSFLNIVSQ